MKKELENPAPAPAEEQVGGLRLRLVVLLCGGSLMALEMAGVRVLEPYFGSTIYVWGSIIGIFLGALSLGYWLGGQAADRHPRLDVLGYIILGSAALSFLVPWLADPLCRWLTGTGSEAEPPVSDPRLRAVLASLILYAPPSALLGMVSPFAIRLAAKAVSVMGSVAGSLYAISTVGSIIGTFLVSFVLVEFFGSKSIIFGIGAVLVLVSIVCLWRSRAGAANATTFAGLLLMAPGAFGLQQAWAAEERNALMYPAKAGGKASHGGLPDRHLFTRESVYHHISVIESHFNHVEREAVPEGKFARYMLFNNQIESGIILDSVRKDAPVQSACGYTRLLHLGVLLTEKAPERVLIIGCGGGIGPQEFSQDYAGAIKQIDVVDIDPMVFDLARRYFCFPAKADEKSGVIRSHVEDGRLFVVRSRETWDYIVLDAYTTGGRIPRHLISQEFFVSVKKHLAPGGILVANVISALEKEEGRLFRAVYRTFADVYGPDSVYIFPRNRMGRRGENIIFVVTTAPGPRLGITDIQQRYAALKGKLLKQPGLDEIVQKVKTTPPEAAEGEVTPLLTDDFCPTDSMVHD